MGRTATLASAQAAALQRQVQDAQERLAAKEKEATAAAEAAEAAAEQAVAQMEAKDREIAALKDRLDEAYEQASAKQVRLPPALLSCPCGACRPHSYVPSMLCCCWPHAGCARQ